MNGLDKDTVVLFAAMASRVENQDAIDAAIVGMLADPKEVLNRCNAASQMKLSCSCSSSSCSQARAGIQEVHFLPFNPVDKRTAITYIDSNGNWHRSSKGAPEQVYIQRTTLFLVILSWIGYLIFCFASDH